MEEMGHIEKKPNYHPKFTTQTDLLSKLGISKSTLSKAIGKNGINTQLKTIWCAYQAEIIGKVTQGYCTQDDHGQRGIEAIGDD